MITELVSMFHSSTMTELGLVLVVIMLFLFGYYAGRIKAGAEYEAELEKLYENQVDPLLAEMAWDKYEEYTGRKG